MEPVTSTTHLAGLSLWRWDAFGAIDERRWECEGEVELDLVVSMF